MLRECQGAKSAARKDLEKSKVERRYVHQQPPTDASRRLVGRRTCATNYGDAPICYVYLESCQRVSSVDIDGHPSERQERLPTSSHTAKDVTYIIGPQLFICLVVWSYLTNVSLASIDPKSLLSFPLALASFG
jgi:hypothetical protein